MTRAILPFVLLAMIVLCNATAARANVVAPDDAHIEIAQLRNGNWRVAYNLSRSVKYLDLGPTLSGFRQADWSVEGDSVKLVVRDGRDFLVSSKEGKRFDTVAVRIKSRKHGLAKHYEPIQTLGPSGAVVYTGHFWPWGMRGGRIKASFFFNPAPGANVSVFGEKGRRLNQWKSIFNHPAFVYFGPVNPAERAGADFIVDPQAPEWISEEFDRFAPEAFDYLENVFRSKLSTKPNIFLAFEPGGPYGLLRFSGDALPGQFQLSLYGGGWETRSPLGVELIQRAIAHESVHLWQTAIHPLDGEVPGWIHEGAADAIASELMTSLGMWTDFEAEDAFYKAQRECAVLLKDGSLATAERRGSIRAIYACGHVLVRAASQAHNGAGSASAFWRAFARRAAKRGGYDAEMFFELVEDSGGSALASAMRRFERTPFARPDREIRALMALASTDGS